MFARISAVLLITGLAFATPAHAVPGGSPIFSFGPDDGAAAAVLAGERAPDLAEPRLVTAETFEILPEFGIPMAEWPVTTASFEILPEFGIPSPELPAEPSFADLLVPNQSLANAPVDPDRFLRFDEQDTATLDDDTADLPEQTTGSLLPSLEDFAVARPRCEAEDGTHALHRATAPLGESREAYEARLTP